MARHAIIVGINEYEPVDWRLDSAITDALAFRDWCTTHGGVDPAEGGSVTLLLSPPQQGATEATRRAIRTAINRFALSPGVAGDRLYVYFAGHGISAPGLGKGGSPVLIPGDVTDLANETDDLIEVDMVVETLRDATPTEQFFFVDACRDFALDDRFEAGMPGNRWLPRGEPRPSSQYGLFATSPGRRAFGAQGAGLFSGELVRALQGVGPKLSYDGNREAYDLTWSALADFVTAEVGERIVRMAGPDWRRYLQSPQPFSRAGAPNPVLRSFPEAEVTPRRASITVSPSTARAVSEVSIVQRIPQGGAIVIASNHTQPLPLPVEFELLPGHYQVVVHGDGYHPVRKPLPLWAAHRQLVITLERNRQGGLEALPVALPATVTLQAGRTDLLLVLRDPAGNVVTSGRDTITANVAPGTYGVQVVRPEGAIVAETLEVRAGATLSWRYRSPPMPVSAHVAAQLATHGIIADADNYVSLSELLGPMPDQTLASILGLAAFAQVWPHSSQMIELRSFAIDVPTVDAASAGITVLVAAADEHPAPDLTLSPAEFLDRVDIALQPRALQPSVPAWLTPLACTRLAGFDAAVQASLVVEPGVHRVRIALPGRAITSYALAALPGRISVLVLVAHASGECEVQQYAIPRAPALALELAQLGPEALGPEALSRLERAQRRFAAGQIGLFGRGSAIDDLLAGKWIDPLFGAIAGYALARLGQLERRALMAMKNMLAHFPELPDSHVLAALADPAHRDAHFQAAVDRGTPVLADGLRALADWHVEKKRQMHLDLEASYQRLIPGSAWTAWISQRPVIEVVGDRIAQPPAGWSDLDPERVAAVARSVGKITGGAAEGTQVEATAFVVGPEHVLLARHVADWLARDGGPAFVEFGAARHSLILEPAWGDAEVALARVGPAPDGTPLPAPLQLARREPRPWQRVYAVMFAQPSSTTGDAAIARAFQARPGGKFVSPGVILALDGERDVLHDCTTASGASGACIVCVSDHRVIAVHYAAKQGLIRHAIAIRLWTLADDPRALACGMLFDSPEGEATMGNSVKRKAVKQFIEQGTFRPVEGMDDKADVPDEPTSKAWLADIQVRRGRLAVDPEGELPIYRDFYKNPKLTAVDVDRLLEAMELAVAHPEQFYDQLERESFLGTVADVASCTWKIPKYYPTRKASAATREKIDELKATYQIDPSIDINPNEHRFEFCDPGWWPLWESKLEEQLQLWPRGLMPFREHGPESSFVYRGKPGTTKVALMADFGVGQYPSACIARQLERHAYPYVFHLGDVYYAGTQVEFDRHYAKPLNKVMDVSTLFSIPENHELYCGGAPYLRFLDENRHRIEQRGSYFAVEFDEHLLVGLDVNWNGRQRFKHPSSIQWLTDVLRQNERKTKILLTGSAPFCYGSTKPTKLYEDLRQWWGQGHFHAWFWGDDHYCALFERTPDTAPFVGSCMGHAGYPGGVRDPDEKTFVPTTWVETEARFPAESKLRPDLANNGWCELTMTPGGGIELLYIDWLGAKRYWAKYEVEPGTIPHLALRDRQAFDRKTLY